MKTKLQDRQTIFDLALCECGSVEAAFELAALNDVSITSTPIDVELQRSYIRNNRIVRYYEKRNIVPATDVQAVQNSAEVNNIEGEYPTPIIDDF